jgi:hypothetical protein
MFYWDCTQTAQIQERSLQFFLHPEESLGHCLCHAGIYFIVQGYDKQCIWTCLLTWKYMKMSFGLCTHWSESVLCQFLYLTMTFCFLLVEIHLSFWAEVHYNSIYPLESKW